MTTDRPVDPPADAFAILNNFKAKPPASVSVTKEIQKDIDKVAQDNGFLSREAKPGKRPRFNSASPKKQLNIKIPIETHERFYRMAEERGIRILGDLIEQALDALEKQPSQGKDL